MFEIILAVLLLAVLVLLVVAAVLTANRSARLSGLTPARNIAAGTHHGGRISKLSDAAIASKYLLGKKGSDDNHFIVCSVAGERSLCVITDEAEAAGDPINCAMHGAADGTRLVRAGAAIAVGDELVPLANGKAQKLPAAAGTYWVFGEAMTAGGDGETIEYAPCKAIPRVVT